MRNPYTRRFRRDRDIDPMAAFNLISKKQRMPAETQTELAMTHWAGFDCMAHGESTFEHWKAIAASLNAALILAERGLGNDYVPYIIAAQEALVATKARATRTGAWRFTGPDMAIVKEALQVVDEQIKFATREQIELALDEADFRARNGHAYPEVASTTLQG